ncbi:MAG: universal stress protein [Thermomicrobiales bacterium]
MAGRAAHAEAYLRDVAAGLAERGITARCEVRPGGPVAAIHGAVREHDATLLALATHGESALAAMPLGSVARQVLWEADAPVVLVHPALTAGPGEGLAQPAPCIGGGAAVVTAAPPGSNRVPAQATAVASPPWRLRLFLGIWAATTLGTGWQVVSGEQRFDQAATLVVLLALLACTAAFLWWLPGPAPPDSAGAARTRRGRFILLALLTALLLFPLRTLIGPPLLFGLPVVAVIALAVARQRPSVRAMGYALGLALVAGIAGLGARWVDFRAPVWAILQVALVLPGLLAGWAILDRTGLLAAGVGRSLALAEGAAARGFGCGFASAIPWALANVALGAAGHDSWVRSWWQPLIAIQPGIAEEAWWRVLLVPIIFVALRQAGRTRAALTAAVLIAGYWFAYLHTPGGLGAIPSTLMLGTLYSLPLSYLWLRRGLEPAIGFHFCIDFVRFGAAYLVLQGWLPG